MTTFRSQLPLLALPATLVALALPADRPTFAPSEGRTVTKTYVNEIEMVLEDMTVVMNGEEADPSMVGLEQTMSQTMRVVVTDTYAKVADGRPQRLRRTYDEIGSDLSMSMSQAMMGDVDVEMQAESELEGRAVVFVWNEDDDAYRQEWADGEGEDELLDGLAEDTDVRLFLPDDEVSEGDTWEVDAEALRGVLAFGGDLKLEFDDSQMQEAMGGMGGGGPMPPPDAFLGELEGSIQAEYMGSREEDGVRVGEIRFTADVETAKDMTEFFREALEDQEMPEGMEVEMSYDSVDIEFEFEGAGTLLWNLETGLLHSFELLGDGTSRIDMAMSMAMMGQEMEMEMSMTMVGDNVTTITTAAGE